MAARLQEITAAAMEAYTAWEVWADAEGWDNNEYDALAAALNRLGAILGKTEETTDAR